ncbi:MAG: lactate racemase domain-containing protein [Lachnospiraceae bacterium]|nr:lactate racemase domain-containing protein [Lachnospiraceae bacterium]
MEIPKVIRAVQKYNQPQIDDVRCETNRILTEFDLSRKIKPGQKIAITCGSRGVWGLVDVVAQTVEEVKKIGAIPFLIPTMGSHGGATAQGQRDMLLSLGYTEERVKAPIVSSMETVEIGETELGTPVYVDKNAYEADGVIVINRVKKHTEHENKTESGLLKMMTIGLGKRDMAALVHSYGVWGLTNIIPANGKFVANSSEMNIICGIALLENARDRVGYLEVVDNKDIPEREIELFKMANEMYPFLPFNICDMLVVKRGGKNISGTGMDCNMIGRFGVWGLQEPEKYYASGCATFGKPLIEIIALLDLTDVSHGNAIGMGQADIITKRYFNKIDYEATYTNGKTTTFLDKIKTPFVAENDFDAIKVGLNSLNGLMRIEGKKTIENVKFCIIDSTLHEGHFLVSSGIYNELKGREDIEFVGDFEELEFDCEGTLINEPISH